MTIVILIFKVFYLLYTEVLSIFFALDSHNYSMKMGIFLQIRKIFLRKLVSSPKGIQPRNIQKLSGTEPAQFTATYNVHCELWRQVVVQSMTLLLYAHFYIMRYLYSHITI